MLRSQKNAPTSAKRTSKLPHDHPKRSIKSPSPTPPTTSIQSSHSSPSQLSTSILTISRRHLAKGNYDKPRKLSQAEMIIQQHKAKQQEAELAKQQKVKQSAPKSTSTSPNSPHNLSSQHPQQTTSNSSTSRKTPKKTDSARSTTHSTACVHEAIEKPLVQPSREFLREQRGGKERPLPPGMTIEELNKMSPEVIAKTLNIDMAIVDALNDDREDEFPVKFSEDDAADSTPPMPFKGDEEGVQYSASRIQGRHTINMMPSVAPRPHNHKGRVTIIRKLPPQFEHVHSKLRSVIQALLKIQKLTHFDLAVTLVAAQGMQFINRQHRFVDAPTDVISFTMEEPYCEGIPVELGNIADLGEIIISVPYIYAQTSIRHAMLRQMGFDISDSKRPLGNMEKVKKLFAKVGEIAINNDGSLRIEELKDVVDVQADATPFGQNAYKLAGNSSLPSITLTSTQLDSLPPFDKDYISATVQDAAMGIDGAVMKHANQLRQAQQLQKALHLQGANASQASILKLQNDLNGNGSAGDGIFGTSGDQIANFNQNTLLTASKTKWTLSQGYPPRDYFKYITESMVVDEMNIVLIHGFLHLCGYDHDTAECREKMQAETDRVVAMLLKEGVISQRCADLATLYDLEEAPESVEECSEDELLPSGLFVDQNVKPMTDEQISAKLKEYQLENEAEEREYQGELAQKNAKKQQQQQQSANSSSNLNNAVKGENTRHIVDAEVFEDSRKSTAPQRKSQRPVNNTTQFQQSEKMSIHTSGPSGKFRIQETEGDFLPSATASQHQIYGATHQSRPTTTRSSDIFRKKKQ